MMMEPDGSASFDKEPRVYIEVLGSLLGFGADSGIYYQFA